MIGFGGAGEGALLRGLLNGKHGGAVLAVATTNASGAFDGGEDENESCDSQAETRPAEGAAVGAAVVFLAQQPVKIGHENRVMGEGRESRLGVECSLDAGVGAWRF